MCEKNILAAQFKQNNFDFKSLHYYILLMKYNKPIQIIFINYLLFLFYNYPLYIFFYTRYSKILETDIRLIVTDKHKYNNAAANTCI